MLRASVPILNAGWTLDLHQINVATLSWPEERYRHAQPSVLPA